MMQHPALAVSGAGLAAEAGLADPSGATWREIITGGGLWSVLVSAGSSPARVADHARGLVFMASPYAEEVHIRRAWRIERSTRMSILAARELHRLRLAGVTAISPVLMMAEMCHAAALLADPPDPLDTGVWERWAAPLLNVAALVVVPDLQGWARCPLILAQVRRALRHNVPVHLYAGGLP